MSVSIEDVDLFLTSLLDEGDWVEHRDIPSWVDLTDVRFTTKERGMSFSREGIQSVQHYDRNGLMDKALDFRSEICEDSYADTKLEPEPVPS